MSRDLFSRYVWLVDTIKSYGSISRRELDECWRRSPFSDGDPLPRRTFFNYRAAIEQLFKLNIVYDTHTNSYSIEDIDEQNNFMNEWLLNSKAIHSILSDSRDVASMIFLEDVPSAREFLSTAISSLKEHRPMVFDYHPYTRLSPTQGIVVEPYFLKIFRQRWYVTGRNVREDAIKTYALDRMSNARLAKNQYEIPSDFDANAYFRDSFGIIFNQGEVKEIVIRVEPRQAKYFRALPLHRSQQETIGDGYSIFRYKMKISDDFVQELLSHGPKVTVVEPPELKAIVMASLQASIANYSHR